MASSRPATAIDPLRFGKRSCARAEARTLPAARIHDDLRLFGVTFAAGFLFVSILIG